MIYSSILEFKEIVRYMRSSVELTVKVVGYASRPKWEIDGRGF